MVRSRLHPLVGVLLAMVGVALVQGVGHELFGSAPIREGMTPEKFDATVRTYLETAPIGALAFPVLAWMFGTFVGTLYVVQLCHEMPTAHTAPVLSVMLICTILMLTMAPHPAWMYLAPVLVVGAWWNGVKYGKYRVCKAQTKRDAEQELPSG